MKLRKRSQVNYYEPEEPSFDAYLYCDRCEDFVYEYCSIHGPLLVIPDDEPKPSGLPSFVPRAALTIPSEFLHLAPSIIPGAGLGVFATLTLPRGVRFGPYRGQIFKDVESSYCWQIYDDKRRATKLVDASDANRSNWMRYVNCARHYREQNLLGYQYQGQIYYRTIKIIPRFTELMVFYGGEFAKSLGINLHYYNTDEYYTRIQDNPTDIPFVETTIKNNLAQQMICEKARIEVQNDVEPDMLVSNTSNTLQDIYDESLPINVGTIQDFVLIDEYSSDFNETRHYNEENNFQFGCNNFDIRGTKFATAKVKKITCQYCFRTLCTNYNLKRHIRLIHPEHSSNIIVNNDTKGTKPDNVQIMDTNELLENDYRSSRQYIEENKRHIESNNNFINNGIELTPTGNQEITCEHRLKTLSPNSSLNSHIRVMHPENSTKADNHTDATCEICNFKSISTRALKRHIVRMHRPRERIHCEICGKSFITKASLQDHIMIYHSEIDIDTKILTCEICNFKSGSTRALKIHIRRIHGPRKRIHCEFCEKSYTRKATLKEHIATNHSAINFVTCFYCNHKTTCLRYLNKHMNQVHNIKFKHTITIKN